MEKRTLRGRYSNSLVIDAGSQFSLRACSQATVTQTQTTDDLSDSLGRLAIQEKPMQLQMGWALSKQRTGGMRFLQKVRDYLITKFNLGEATGKKADPHQVSLDMRLAREHNGERRFKRDEWLTKTQIQGVFSRLAKARRKGLALPMEAIEDFPMDDDEEEAISTRIFFKISGKQLMLSILLFMTSTTCANCTVRAN